MIILAATGDLKDYDKISAILDTVFYRLSDSSTNDGLSLDVIVAASYSELAHCTHFLLL